MAPSEWPRHLSTVSGFAVSQGEGEPVLSFFEDFQELSERSKFRDLSLLLEGERVHSNPVCGDRVRVEIALREGVLQEYRYNVQGCWPTHGCLELLGERFLKKPAQEATRYTLLQFLSEVKNVPPGKRHAFGLAYRAFVSELCRKLAEQENLALSTVGRSP